MKKRGMTILCLFIMIVMAGVVFGGNTQSQGVVSLFIENNTCGNGVCSNGETCSTCPADCGACPVAPSGGGGGGGGDVKVKNLSLDKDLIKVSLKQGKSVRETLTINNGAVGSMVKLSVDSEALKRYMILSEESFFLAAGKSKTVNVDFFVGETELPETYLGRIIVSSEGLIRVVNVLLEIKEKRALFDIITKVQNAFTYPGGNVNANMRLTNMGDLNNIDVTLYYAIKDFDNKVITFREETLAVDREIEITRGLDLPGDISLGSYVFYSSINYGENATATSSDVFEVISLRELVVRNLMIAFLVILVLVTVIMVLRIYGARKREQELRKSKRRRKKSVVFGEQ